MTIFFLCGRVEQIALVILTRSRINQDLKKGRCFRMRTTLFLFVAALLFATPAMATVAITTTDEGTGQQAKIQYSVSGESARARALSMDISVDNGCTILAICNYKTGESTAASKGFGIFPGSINLADPENPVWGDPVAPNTDPGAQGGLGTNAITVEMGSLYVEEVNAPGDAGVLFSIVISRTAADCNVTVALNSTRGGIVLENGQVPSSISLPPSTYIDLTPPCLGFAGRPWGDATGEGMVNIGDLMAVRKAWMKSEGQCDYNVCANFVELGDQVNIADLMKVRQYWMQSVPP